MKRPSLWCILIRENDLINDENKYFFMREND